MELLIARRLNPLPEAVWAVFSWRKGLLGWLGLEMDDPPAFARLVAWNPAGFSQGFGPFRGLTRGLVGLV
jgi:hypothetical protein